MFSKFAFEISLPVDVAQYSYIPLFHLYVGSFTYVNRRGLARTSAAVSALIGAFEAAGVFSHWQPRCSGLARTPRFPSITLWTEVCSTRRLTTMGKALPSDAHRSGIEFLLGERICGLSPWQPEFSTGVCWNKGS